MSIMFNLIYINEEMLPIYTYTYVYKYIYIWGKVTLDQCGKLVANYRKRLEPVKQNRGYTTKY